MSQAHLSVFRGSPGTEGEFVDYDVPVEEGMVVLDALHWIQANGGAGPRRPLELQGGQVRLVQLRDQRSAEPVMQDPAVGFRPGRDDHGRADARVPAHPRPGHRRLLELRGQQADRAVQPAGRPTQEDWRWQQEDIERVQEFRKCIECFLCQDVCHVLRNHETERPFMGPRYLVRTAGLEMHPIDTADRREYLKDEGGVGYCNITKCCTEVCPEHIKITDNAIIPLKERVADRYYDPIQIVWRKIRGDRADTGSPPVPSGSLETLGGGPETPGVEAGPGVGTGAGEGRPDRINRARRVMAPATPERRAEPGRTRARSDLLAGADVDAPRR